MLRVLIVVSLFSVYALSPFTDKAVKVKSDSLQVLDNTFEFTAASSPINLLHLLRNTDNRKVKNKVTYLDRAPLGWIKKSDLKDIMQFISLNDTAKCFVSNLSSTHGSIGYSIISGHAIEMIECYRKQERYPRDFHLCPTVDQSKSREVQLWWIQNK